MWNRRALAEKQLAEEAEAAQKKASSELRCESDATLGITLGASYYGALTTLVMDDDGLCATSWL